MERIEVEAAPGFADTLAAAWDTAGDRPRWVTVYGLAAAGLVLGAMTSGSAAGAVAGVLAGPVVGLAAFRLGVRPWQRSGLRSHWSFTPDGVVELLVPPGGAAATVRRVHPCARVERVVVRDRRVLVRRDDVPTTALPREAFAPGEADVVLGWARAAGVAA